MVRPAIRIPTQLVSIILLAGSSLLLFFILLAGIKSDGNVLNKWYFISADTSKLPGATYPVTRWSLYGICGYETGESVTKPGNFIGCTDHKADYPFDPVRNFKPENGTWNGTWTEFETDRYYYETRFQFPFYLIALFFNTVALFASVFSCFRWVAIGNTVLSCLTFIFSTCAASLTTAAYVQAKNVFKKHDADAKVGATLFGFAWAVVFMAILNTFFFLVLVPRQKEHDSYITDAIPSTERGAYKFGFGKKKTTQVDVDNKDASSFVRA